MLGLTTTASSVATGLKDIADALGGGIRENSLIIIEGEAKAGKSVISQHILNGILCSRECSVACYTTDKDVENLIARMDSLSLHVTHDFVTDRLRIYIAGSSDPLENTQENLQLLTTHISELPDRFKLVIIDSVTPLISRSNRVIKMDFLQTCKELCEQGRSIALVMDTHVFEGSMLSRVYTMSDYYLKLKTKDKMLDTGQVDTRDVKILEVTKLGGAECQKREGIKFEIKPNVGIQILPFVTVRI